MTFTWKQSAFSGPLWCGSTDGFPHKRLVIWRCDVYVCEYEQAFKQAVELTVVWDAMMFM